VEKQMSSQTNHNLVLASPAADNLTAFESDFTHIFAALYTRHVGVPMNVGFRLLLVVVLLFILFALSVPETTDKDVLYHKEINALLSPRIFKAMPQQAHHVELSSESTPCQTYFDQFSAKRTLSMSSKRISFKDSNQSWIICHCSINQNEAWDYLFTHLSRVPLVLREQIKTVVTFPIESSPLFTESKVTIQPHGLMSESTAVFFGEPPIGTWIHEFAHALDVNARWNGRDKFSDSKLWKRALQMDACVTDAYAKTSTQEVNNRLLFLIYLCWRFRRH
jgi:hypothetical protein